MPLLPKLTDVGPLVARMALVVGEELVEALSTRFNLNADVLVIVAQATSTDVTLVSIVDEDERIKALLEAAYMRVLSSPPDEEQ